MAVLNFGNLSSSFSTAAGVDMGTKLADYLTADLIEEYRGADPSRTFIRGVRTNTYEVIERSRLDQILKEQNLQVSGLVDDNQAVEIGKLLGLDALVTGSLSYEYKDETGQSSYKDKNGNVHTTYSLTRTVTAEARMKIISIKTAQILGTSDSKMTDSDSQSSDKGYPSAQSLKSPQQLAEQCYKSIAYRFANYFAPYFSHETFDVKNIKLKDFKDRADDAEKFMKQGEINQAYKLYKAIYDIDNYNPQVAYNLGILYEVVGDYERAFEHYQIAIN
ncbi:MAG: hypothetical protein HC880_13440, partial [Bacteroidia bacterium]|nr:hypothetical protein [Bacteroidia bacterium]